MMKKRLKELEERFYYSPENSAARLTEINKELREMVIIPKWWLIFAGIVFGAGLIAMIANFF